MYHQHFETAKMGAAYEVCLLSDNFNHSPCGVLWKMW